MNIPAFNIFITNHFETEDLNFQCVFDSSKFHPWYRKYIDILTHIVKTKKWVNLRGSVLFEDNTELKDIGCLLSVAQWTHIFFDTDKLWRVTNQRKESYAMFLSEEIGPFIDNALKVLRDLDKDNPQMLQVIKKALLMFYEAKHMLVFDGLRGILMMNCFEFLIGSIYRQDENYNEDNLKLECPYHHILGKFNYQEYIDQKLQQEIWTKKLSEFKKRKWVKSIASFVEQFQKMRNWIAHWKQHTKPDMPDSPSDSEFTFFYRLESFIRIIVIELLNNNDYQRKFDILYQLILEQNVCPTLTPEFPKLKFISKQ